MKVNRIVANIATDNPELARRFYQDLLGLDIIMDFGWITTFGSKANMPVQISFATEGGAGTEVPDISIEVDDLDSVLDKALAANITIEYGPCYRVMGGATFLCA